MHSIRKIRGILGLLLQLICLERLLILIWCVHLEVIEQRTTSCNLSKKSFSSRVIPFVLLKVLSQKFNLFGKNRNLNSRRTRVFLVRLMFGDELFLGCALDGHE